MSIGLGHTMLRSTEVVANDRQPARLGTFWITADVRLDCKSELVEKLTKLNRGYIDIRGFGRHADLACVCGVGAQIVLTTYEVTFLLEYGTPPRRHFFAHVIISESSLFITQTLARSFCSATPLIA